MSIASRARFSLLPALVLLLGLFATTPAEGQSNDATLSGLAIKVIPGTNYASATVDSRLQLEEPFPNLTFSRPVDFQVAGDGSGRIFVVEQAGRIKVFNNRSDIGSADTFLDITSRVNDAGYEEGLLGLAFHPRYSTNGYFFVNYTTSSSTVVARYSVDPNAPDRALPGSESVILRVARPHHNHNGGQIVFGSDGYLYIALGDGDERENGQNRSTLLGSILRIDVDGGSPYAIPPDNPFVGNTQGYREEIYAYGLRNPWRISFGSGSLWAADVGETSYEEVNIVEKGGNYGWDIMEGRHCYEPAMGCNPTGLTLPVWEYPTFPAGAIIGGYVYYGSLAPPLSGRYIFADFGTGEIWALEQGDKAWTALETNLSISSFGVDAKQELYVLDLGGSIYRFTGGSAGDIESGENDDTIKQAIKPNNLTTKCSIVDGRGSVIQYSRCRVIGEDFSTQFGGEVVPEGRAIDGSVVLRVSWTMPSYLSRVDYFEFRVREGWYYYGDAADDVYFGPEVIPWTRVEKSEDGVTLDTLRAEVNYMFFARSIYDGGKESQPSWINLPVIPPLPSSTSAKDGELPETVSLGQNHPNPFNSETTISYALPQAGRVRLVVYDLLGQEVAVLVNEPKPAGHHTVHFIKAGNLPSGAYVYRLQAQEKIMVQIMTLVK